MLLVVEKCWFVKKKQVATNGGDNVMGLSHGRDSLVSLPSIRVTRGSVSFNYIHRFQVTTTVLFLK